MPRIAERDLPNDDSGSKIVVGIFVSLEQSCGTHSCKDAVGVGLGVGVGTVLQQVNITQVSDIYQGKSSAPNSEVTWREIDFLEQMSSRWRLPGMLSLPAAFSAPRCKHEACAADATHTCT